MSATKSRKVRARHGGAAKKRGKSKAPHRGAAIESIRDRPAIPGQEACVCTCGDRTFDPFCDRHTERVVPRGGLPKDEAEKQARIWTQIREQAERDRTELRLTDWHHSALSEPETLGDWLVLLLTGGGGYQPKETMDLMIRSAFVAISHDLESLARAELSARTMRDNFGAKYTRDQYSQILHASARAWAAAELLPRILKANAEVQS